MAKFHWKLSNLEPSSRLLVGRPVSTNQQLVEKISHSFVLTGNLWLNMALFRHVYGGGSVAHDLWTFVAKDDINTSPLDEGFSIFC